MTYFDQHIATLDDNNFRNSKKAKLYATGFPTHQSSRQNVLFTVQTSCQGYLKYSFTTKLSGTPVPQVPDGYEVYEHSESAQVLIRKIVPSKIRPEEEALLEKLIRDKTKDLLFFVEKEAESLVVYTSDMDADFRLDFISQIAPMTNAHRDDARSFMIAHAKYSKMMRFMLVDEEERLFCLDRWCFLGGIDKWYMLDGDKPLSQLANKYVRHLGQESFFELM